ncbi:hypothetical protein B0H13DRAFT_1925826 [Mycena leptocephala]|nr:hypothetical protein B0H13DRAFT_1925826 [Mycena leptocephala]
MSSASRIQNQRAASLCSALPRPQILLGRLWRRSVIEFGEQEEGENVDHNAANRQTGRVGMWREPSWVRLRTDNDDLELNIVNGYNKANGVPVEANMIREIENRPADSVFLERLCQRYGMGSGKPGKGHKLEDVENADWNAATTWREVVAAGKSHVLMRIGAGGCGTLENNNEYRGETEKNR